MGGWDPGVTKSPWLRQGLPSFGTLQPSQGSSSALESALSACGPGTAVPPGAHSGSRHGVPAVGWAHADHWWPSLETLWARVSLTRRRPGGSSAWGESHSVLVSQFCGRLERLGYLAGKRIGLAEVPHQFEVEPTYCLLPGVG